MKKSHCLSLLTVLFLSLTAISGADERKRFIADKNGKVIDATLVSHPGVDSGKVTIRTDGKEFTIELSVLREEDQKFIRDWMAKTPAVVSYDLDVTATKTKVEDGDYAYKLSIKNDGKNSLGRFKIQYRTYMENSQEKTVYREHEVEVEGPLDEGKTATLTTKTFDPDVIIVEGKNGVSRSSVSVTGFGKKNRPKLLGLLVRVYDGHGKLVEDWRTPENNFKEQWESPAPEKKKEKKPAVIIE